MAKYDYDFRIDLAQLRRTEAELVQLTQADREYWLLKAVRARLHADLRKSKDFNRKKEASYNQIFVEDVDLNAAIAECEHRGIAEVEIGDAYDRERQALKDEDIYGGHS